MAIYIRGMYRGYAGDGDKSFSRYEREMYPDQVAELERNRDEQEDDDNDPE
jgi:hypothetical protein